MTQLKTITACYEMEDCYDPKVGDSFTHEGEKFKVHSVKQIGIGDTWDEYEIVLKPDPWREDG